MSPRERGPEDYDELADRFARAVAGALEQVSQRPMRNGDEESNWKTVAMYVLGFLQAVILLIMGYMYNTMAQTHDDVIQIKCKIDPQCRVIVSATK